MSLQIRPDRNAFSSSARSSSGQMSGGQCVTALEAGRLQFSPENSGRVSVFSAGDLAEGVTIRGLAYGLEQSPLSCDFPLGVSNAFTGQPAEVSLSRGRLLVMWQQEAKTAVDRIRRGGQL